MKRLHHGSLRENNRLLVLKTIFEAGEVSRTEISQITNLSPTTVSRMVKELMERGFVVESKKEASSLGRSRILLAPNSKAYKVLLFDVGVTFTTYAIGKFDKSIKILSRFKTPDTPDLFFKKVHKILETLPEIDAISMSFPGMVNMNTFEISYVPYLDWRKVSIKKFLRTDTPILMDNEANLAVFGEIHANSDMKTTLSAVYVVIREGVGTGLYLNGKVYRGPSFTAGEAGHTTIEFSESEKCRCGNRGCWENYASIYWPVRKFGPDKLAGDTILEKFHTLIEKPEAKKLINDYIKNISVGIANIVNILNPEVVILGGEALNFDDETIKRITKEVKQRALFEATESLKIVRSTFKGNPYLYGALLLAIEKNLFHITT
ncbi:ROK family transcriptional regulator [Thermosipho ferrireducens]|uniref:ROK family transcriptional regulator n=1 Tax=Thermosipho ferrireducens TaxID=2571116 RepID=A0ABX7S8S2_9BACT|nr:ROK family transcriptional regulator [Thermosipho ferrireducens]QTA38210.1 ROK family transcriptional regulator [Thermosipho ferrireducens]